MPGQDGYVLMMRLKDLLGPAMPRVTIALTAHAGEGEQRRALSAGFQRHVAKPVDPFALIQLVRDLMSGSTP